MSDKIPVSFQAGEHLVDSALVKGINFFQFVDYVKQASLLPDKKKFDIKLKRIRLQQQVIYFAGDAVVPITIEDVLQMPIAAARAIDAKLDEDEGVPGKIIRPGDGIDTAIGYELGRPIPVQGKEPIRELEFIAKTYGDIEDVLSAADNIEQAANLIRTVAKPVYGSMQALPSWAVDQICSADGFQIAQKVLPVFLGQEAA